ncbi:PEP-CTERM sorting domain-containing protein [Aquabacterium sp. OR-4]|uniref:PEP-CTERM sorting domain-containing protein n=1 Tax=Aquabacterium sp. OR-4 TaxID=2978127 RepID=UPI0021B22F9B|nr:PEP-CTERM sorting domain-containing protein [Aquabacterium sp. OR-4]MDT7838316.1 PEP-CTERM sorting domain-containing protein [Aquabacterium sp. OR-4]
MNPNARRATSHRLIRRPSAAVALSTLGLLLATAVTPAQAATNHYDVHHDYAFFTSNWLNLWGWSSGPVGYSRYTNWATVNGLTDVDNGTEWLPANSSTPHQATMSTATGHAVANTEVVNRTASFSLPGWWGGWAGVNYIWGSTHAWGNTSATPNTNTRASAVSSVAVDFGRRQWGYTGWFYWQPRLSSSSFGSSVSTERSRRMFDPIIVRFDDIEPNPLPAPPKPPVEVKLLDVLWEPTLSDPGAGYTWDAAAGTLRLTASQQARFTLTLDARYVADPGTLSISFDDDGQAQFSGTGRFAGLQANVGQVGIASLTLPAISLQYTLPVDTYELSLSGGVGPIPEPGTWWLMGAGTALLAALRRRKPAMAHLLHAG